MRSKKNADRQKNLAKDKINSKTRLGYQYTVNNSDT